MPKQRRTAPKPVAKKTKKKPASRPKRDTKPARKPARASAVRAGARKASASSSKKTARKTAARPNPVKPQPKSRPAAAPAVATSHEQAVQAFERGFRALQQRQFDRAASALKAVLTGFPDEKEMQERARVYLSLCERQAGGAGVKLRSFEERLNGATVAINRGAFEDALRLLHNLESENAASDHVQYLMTVAFTATGAVDHAIAHLRRAIELNPENRRLSVADTDLEPLRQHASFLAALEAPAAPRSRQRTTARKR